MKNKIIMKIVLIVMLIAMISSVSIVAVAEGEPASETNRVTIMHLTDPHYIPTYYCYTGDLADNDFATKIKGDPKLMLESYAVLETSLKMIKEANPDYLLVTGDITSNGEKQSLVDSANALRKLQNEIRAAGNTDFQILCVPGNHDVFNNRHAANYSSGKKVEAESASRLEFAKIFSSLGYPDLTDEEAKNFYKPDEWSATGKHLPYEPNGDVAFINSTTSNKLTFEYYAEDLDNPAKINQLGGLTYMAYDNENKLSFAGFDSNLSVEGNQRTEGEYTKANIDWYCNKDLTNYTQIAMGHHNIIKHFSMQEQFVPKFITYGWEEVAERLATKGVRYSYTGHFHANDMNTYVSKTNNNLMYEIETGATISYGAAIRETAIVDFEDGAQDFESVLLPIEEADFTYLVEKGLLDKEYEKLLDKNNNMDIQKYIQKKLFKPWLYNMVDSFVGPAKLGAKIDDINKNIMGIEVKDVVKKLISEINTKVLKDYEYKGDNPAILGEENKIYGYLSELIIKGVKCEVAIGHNLNDLMIYSYGAHLMGAEPAQEKDLPLWVKDAYKKYRSGKGVDQVFDKIINGKNGVYDLVEKLATTPLDLSEFEEIKGILSLVGIKDADLSNIVLNDLAPKAIEGLNELGIIGEINLHGNTLMDDVDTLLDSFLTDSFKRGFGRVLIDIASSFSLDDTYDGAFNEEMVYKYQEGDKHSFSKTGKAEEKATYENGRLPSQVTVTFGKNPETDKNVTWFTSRFMPQAKLQYKVVDTNEWITVPATTQLMPYPDTLFDMGFILTYVDKNIARHNVRLTGLSPNTAYYYRVGYGDEETGVWSDIGIFRTAKDNNQAFSVAIASEMQQMESLSYEEMLQKLMESNKQFENKTPDFFISLGDIVDNGKNTNQWESALNTMAKYWRNITQVVVPGKQDGAMYTSGEKENADNVTVEEMEYSMLNLHYDLNGESVVNQKNYFSFDYSAVHFIVLDTNDIQRDALSSAQVKWLKEDLKATTKPFKVVLMHKGIYSPGEHADTTEIKTLRKQLSPIFYENKVNIVFSGYEHVYAETQLLNGEGKVAEDGVLYVTVGSFGDKGKKFVENENIPLAFGKELHYPNLESQTYVKLSYDGEALQYQGYIFKDFYFVKVQDYPAVRLMWMWISLGVLALLAITGAIVGSIIVTKNKKKETVLATSGEGSNEIVVENETQENQVLEESEETTKVDAEEELDEEAKTTDETDEPNIEQDKDKEDK